MPSINRDLRPCYFLEGTTQMVGTKIYVNVTQTHQKLSFLNLLKTNFNIVSLNHLFEDQVTH